MNIINCNDYETMARQGAEILIKTIKDNPRAVITLATGSSPKRMYKLFVETINHEKIDISEVTFLKLDEWYGVAPDADCTCTTFIKEILLDQLYMPPKQYIEFVSNAEDVSEELKKVDDFIANHTIDVMILGLGMNGHLGLNEPSNTLHYHCHQTKLNEKTKTHSMAQGYPLESGLSIGLEGIFKAKQVLMLVCGERKEEAYKAFLSQNISTLVPASLLWLHHNCTTLIDRNQFPND